MKAAYDYIIAGAGCAGLSLLARIISSGLFTDKRILLVDREQKNKNDRTWCFWEKENGFFDELVYSRWDHLWFHADAFSKRYDISPYQYKMIRGIDFYEYCFRLIRASANTDILYGEIDAIESHAGETLISINGQKISGGMIFSSIIPSAVPSPKDHYLLQHFRGWFVHMQQPAFQPGEATLMDFRVSQEEGTSFVYVMPFSPADALVEYTLFSREMLPAEKYEEGLRRYMEQFYAGIDYTITERESGAIPMTNMDFGSGHHQLVHIGTAGGRTKPSSGYTFQFIQKHSEAIVDDLMKGVHPGKRPAGSRKFHFYDSVLLNVLATEKYPGNALFADLFRNNHIQDLFQFLDNESHLLKDLSIISSLPTLPFLRAGFEETVKK